MEDIVKVDLRAEGNEGRGCSVLTLNVNHWRDFRHELCSIVYFSPLLSAIASNLCWECTLI